MKDEILSELREKMKDTVEALKKEFKRIRTGRASTALLDGIKVDCYGTQMPLDQVACLFMGMTMPAEYIYFSKGSFL